MPHINRIRVNNVKYNFGTQFYDDFVLRFSGKNTIYDLANGGGKSVLMLLLLQNMLPNCTLDEKQPIEKLFRSGSGNSTIHSLVEWQLNKDNIKNGYKYMTTGFCARKAKDTSSEGNVVRDNAAIEYFNYVIFYREFNDNDIKNLPLSNGKERITYNGLKNYLKDLEHRDYSLIIKIFERKGEYQQFISQYGIYESEWEIIRGINKTEGHVRTYFESNYKTTRKVVEDLLIEEILQKSYYNNTGEGADFAKLLLDIKNKLVELTKKKNDIANYDRQIEILNSFVARVQSLKGMYHKKGGIEKEFVHAYNTCLKAIEKTQEDKKTILVEREQLLLDKKEKEAKIDTAQVQMEEEELIELDNAVKATKEILEEFEKELSLEKEQLLFKENANDYLEYLNYKKEYEAAKIAAEGIHGKSEDAVQRLALLVKLWKELSEQEKQELQTELSGIVAERKEKQTEEAELSHTLQELEEETTFQKSKIHFLKEDAEYNLKKLEELKKQTSVLLFEEVSANKEKLQDKVKLLEEQILVLFQKEKQTEETIVNNRLCLGVLKEQEKNLLLQQEELVAFQKEYGRNRERIEKLKEFYNENDESQLENSIYGAYANNALETYKLKTEIKELKETCKAYEKGQLFADSQEISKALDIMNVGKIRAVTGASYINKFAGEKREELLELYPILPYAVVALEDYESIRFDKNLKKLCNQGNLIPIIPEKSLTSLGDELYHQENIDFIMLDKAEFTSDETLQKVLKEAINLLEEKQKRILTLAERKELMKADISYMNKYESRYLMEKADKQKEYEDNKLKLKDISAEMENLQVVQNDFYNKKVRIKEELEAEEKQRTELEQELKAIEEIEELYQRYEKKEEEVVTLKQQVSKKEEERKHLEKELNETRENLKLLANRCNVIEVSLKEMEDNWNAYFKEYEKENLSYTNPQWNGLSLEEIEIKFKGLRDAFVAENADIADKKKLAENYKLQMEKSITSIEYRNGKMEELKALHEKHQMINTSLHELKNQKEKITEIEEKIKVSKKQLEAYAETANRKFGSIAHGKTLVEEKYGFYEPLKISGEQLKRFIEEYKNLIQVMEKDVKESLQKEKEVEKEITSLEAMKEDMLRMIQSAGIEDDGEQGVLEEEQSLKKTYEELRGLYEKIMKEEYERREAFEKDKNRLKDTLIKTEAYELANEVEKHIESPSNEGEAERLIENIADTISCIELEKSSVKKGIEDMEKIKHNFESQCLQTCVNMKSALDRLPKLSGIQLDGKLVPMITLSIPYIKEELYEDAMSNYIDDIIRTADSFTTESERVKYIRNQLAWKKLFSVIVKDMNLIKLNLYKRERIKEQSRYLKYEDAVGSTGQSQGIYIQFLVAIIHYITSMNSANSDPMKLKNVIFIDNPFGAAKDVYIWEPIFKLLKANNVQLIVPARGATPAITGRFEVNYILGQKLIDGRQQTVVVDYRSQIEESELEYTSLSYEQSSLVFES